MEVKTEMDTDTDSSNEIKELKGLISKSVKYISRLLVFLICLQPIFFIGVLYVFKNPESSALVIKLTIYFTAYFILSKLFGKMLSINGD